MSSGFSNVSFGYARSVTHGIGGSGVPTRCDVVQGIRWDIPDGAVSAPPAGSSIAKNANEISDNTSEHDHRAEFGFQIAIGRPFARSTKWDRQLDPAVGLIIFA